jgi:hypothetical protein
MLNFKDISALQSILTAIYKDAPGESGKDLFCAVLQRNLNFTIDQAKKYAAIVLAHNTERSAEYVGVNCDKLIGEWAKGSDSSAGNLVVNRTESWIFSEDLTYEIRYESYEGYTSPFGGGYSRPRSSSTFGIWSPSDLPSSPFPIVTIDQNGLCSSKSVEWTDMEQSMPSAMYLNRALFSKM